MTKVLFDASHKEKFTINEGFKKLSKLLEANGFIVSETSSKDKITFQNLSQYDVLVITSPSERFSEPEINDILAYVAAGGNLLIFVDKESSAQVNSLISDLGVKITDKEIEEKSTNSHGFQYTAKKETVDIEYFDRQSYLFEGIKKLHLKESCLMFVVAPARALAWSSFNSKVLVDKLTYKKLVPAKEIENRFPFGSRIKYVEVNNEYKYGIFRQEYVEEYCSKSIYLEGPFPVMAYVDVGKGRILCVASSSILTDTYLNYEDHRRFALNIFLWIFGVRVHEGSIGLYPGYRLLNRYELIEVLGKGAWKETWKAYDHKLAKKIVVVKVLTSKHSKEGLDDLRREVEVAGPLKHENIVEILDVNDKEGFLVEEFVEGKNLESLIREHCVRGTWFSIHEVVEIFQQVLKALEYLNSFKPPRIHGDIKPANILVKNDGVVKLTDFGVGKLLLEEEEQQHYGTYMRRLGSQNYIAPEVFLGKRRNIQTDLFSVGILAYLLLTQKHPFLHPSGLCPIPNLIQSEIFKPDPPIKYNKRIPNKLSNIIMKLLEKDPQKRYDDPKSVLKDLESVKL